MIELYLIGYTADLEHLVLGLDEDSSDGRYRLVVEPDLFATLDEVRRLRRDRDLPVGDPLEFADRIGVDEDTLRQAVEAARTTPRDGGEPAAEAPDDATSAPDARSPWPPPGDTGGAGRPVPGAPFARGGEGGAPAGEAGEQAPPTRESPFAPGGDVPPAAPPPASAAPTGTPPAGTDSAPPREGDRRPGEPEETTPGAGSGRGVGLDDVTWSVEPGRPGADQPRPEPPEPSEPGQPEPDDSRDRADSTRVEPEPSGREDASPPEGESPPEGASPPQGESPPEGESPNVRILDADEASRHTTGRREPRAGDRAVGRDEAERRGSPLPAEEQLGDVEPGGLLARLFDEEPEAEEPAGRQPAGKQPAGKEPAGKEPARERPARHEEPGRDREPPGDREPAPHRDDRAHRDGPARPEPEPEPEPVAEEFSGDEVEGPIRDARRGGLSRSGGRARSEQGPGAAAGSRPGGRQAEPGGRGEQAARSPSRPRPPAADRPSPRRPVREPDLTPAQIQARLRAGRSPDAVAEEAGTEVGWIKRWLGPIEAERAHILEEARSVRLDRSRQGRSRDPLGRAVERNLDRVAVDRDSVDWEVARRSNGHWKVSVYYVEDGRDRQATWTYDPGNRVLTAASPEARDIGFTHRGGSG